MFPGIGWVYVNERAHAGLGWDFKQLLKRLRA